MATVMRGVPVVKDPRRILDKLEHHGMIGRRLCGAPNNLGHREVYLEATGIGHFWARCWQDWQADTTKAAKAQRIPLAEQRRPGVFTLALFNRLGRENVTRSPPETPVQARRGPVAPSHC